MATKTIVELDAASSVALTDIVELVTDPAGTPASEKATLQQVVDLIVEQDLVITGTLEVPTPTEDEQAVPKGYVDAALESVGGGGIPKVRAATTTNITISTALNNGDTIDGVSLVTDDLVLVKNQSSAEQNGVYKVAASPVRAEGFATGAELTGTVVVVTEGSVNQGRIFIQFARVITLDASPCRWGYVGGFTASSNQTIALHGVVFGSGANSVGNYGVAIGEQATSGGDSATAIGRSAAAGGSSAVSAGYGANASGNNSIALGVGATATREYEFCRQKLSSVGSLRTLVYTLLTSDATKTEIKLGWANSQRVIVPDGSACHCILHVMASTGGYAGTDFAIFTREFMVYRTYGGTITVVNGGTSIAPVQTGGSPSGWVIDVTADVGNQAIKIEVTGEASHNIRWVAKLETVWTDA